MSVGDADSGRECDIDDGSGHDDAGDVSTDEEKDEGPGKRTGYGANLREIEGTNSRASVWKQMEEMTRSDESIPNGKRKFDGETDEQQRIGAQVKRARTVEEMSIDMLAELSDSADWRFSTYMDHWHAERCDDVWKKEEDSLLLSLFS